MAEKCVASTIQYIYKRNFNENKWQDVGNGACRIQVKKRGNNYTLNIRLPGPDGESLKLPLSPEQKLHLSSEFVQIPLANNRELYGIKFTEQPIAEEFYGKVRSQMGQPWNDDKVGRDKDDLPQPFSTYEPKRQQQPIPAERPPLRSLPHNSPQSTRRQDDYGGGQRVGGGQNMGNLGGIGAGGAMPRAGGGGAAGGAMPRAGGGEAVGGAMPRAGGGGVVGGAMPRVGGGEAVGGAMPRAGGGGVPVSTMPRAGGGGVSGNTMPRAGGGGVMRAGGGDIVYADIQTVDDGGVLRASREPGYSYRAGADHLDKGEGYFGGGQNRIGGSQFGAGPENPDRVRRVSGGRSDFGARGLRRQEEDVVYSEVRHDARFNNVAGNPGGVGGAGHRPAGQQQQQQYPPFHLGGSGAVGGSSAGERNPPARVKTAWDTRPAQREPLPVSADQIPDVVQNLMMAINKRAKEDALKFLQSLLTSDAESGRVDIKVSLKKEEPKVKEFMLKLHVEFQQPRPPLPMFVEAQETDTIERLQTKVQGKFFIPKKSQNWIIGDKLMSDEDCKKKLSDFVAMSEDTLDTVPIFVYVRHTKKAEIPTEVADAVKKNLKDQRDRQQQQQPQPLPPQTQLPPVLEAQGGNMGEYRTLHVDSSGPGVRGEFVTRNPPPQERGGTESSGAPSLFTGGRQLEDRLVMEAPQPGGHQLEDMVSRGAPQPSRRQLEDRLVGETFPPSGLQLEDRLAREAPQPLHEDDDNGDFHAILGIPAQLRVDSKPRLPPVAEKRGWGCPICTFINDPQRPGCEQCGTERPADYVVPKDQMDERTREAMENEMLLVEYLRTEKEREAREAEENYKKYLEADDVPVVLNEEPFECTICYMEIPPGEGITLRNCVHQFCKECLNGTVVNSPDPEVKCPFADGGYDCGAPISEREIRAVVTQEELDALHRKGLMQAESSAANSFHCRTTNCQAFCYYEDAVNEFHCPLCQKKNCLLCKAIHEGMNCQEYQDDLKRRAANDEAAKETQKMLEEMIQKGDAMYCPQCNVIVQKKDGCDWICCAVCKTEICWATKQRRWGPKGRGDISGGCRCRVNKKKCHPNCGNCH